MYPHIPHGRSTRPSPAWPEFRPSPSRENLACADAVIRALGAAPPPGPRRRYYAQTPDGRRVTTRSSQPVEVVIDVLEHKAQCTMSDRLTSHTEPPDLISDQHFDTGAHQDGTRSFLIPHPVNQQLRYDPWADPRTLANNQAETSVAAQPYVRQSALLSERAPTFLRYVHQKTTSRSPVCDTIMTLRLFIELVGDKRLCDITVEDTDKFLQALSVWPVHASKRRDYRLMRAPEVLNKARILRTTPLSLRTQQKHIDRLRTFFRWLEQRREIKPGFLFGIRIYKRGQDIGFHREPFSEAELRMIFDVHSATKFEAPFMFWAPLLGLYQGLRVNELAQLYVDDVRKLGGRWCLDITRDRPGQRLKNRHSRRCMPLHPMLIQCGFLEFVEQARRWRRTTLFPGVVWGINGPGDSVGDWFNRTFLRKRCGINTPTRTFHSFRHCFATFGERSKVLDTRLALMLGHSAGQSVLRVHYVKLATPGDMSDDLNAIAFPKIEHTKYVPEAYEKAFAKADLEESRQVRLNAVYGSQKTSSEQRRLH